MAEPVDACVPLRSTLMHGLEVRRKLHVQAKQHRIARRNSRNRGVFCCQRSKWSRFWCRFGVRWSCGNYRSARFNHLHQVPFRKTTPIHPCCSRILCCIVDRGSYICFSLGCGENAGIVVGGKVDIYWWRRLVWKCYIVIVFPVVSAQEVIILPDHFARHEQTSARYNCDAAGYCRCAHRVCGWLCYHACEDDDPN
jgi:hypothetical protein